MGRKVTLKISKKSGDLECLLVLKQEDSGTVLKFLNNDDDVRDLLNALYNDVAGFEYSIWKEFPIQDFFFEGLVYKPFGEKLAIPRETLTQEVLDNFLEILAAVDSLNEAVEITKAFNALFKVGAIQRFFVALVGEGMTANRLKIMAACAEQIAAAIGGVEENVEIKSAIVYVISRMDTGEITKKSMEAIATILEQPILGYSKDEINALFLEGKVTAEKLKAMAGAAVQIAKAIKGGRNEYTRSAITTVISRMDAQEITEESIKDLATILEQPISGYSEDLFPGDAPITAKMLKEILEDLTRSASVPVFLAASAVRIAPAPHFISPHVPLGASQIVPVPKSVSVPKSAPGSVSNSGDASHGSHTDRLEKQRQAADQQKVGVTLP